MKDNCTLSPMNLGKILTVMLLLSGGYACSSDCKPLHGAWSNGEGQTLVFGPGEQLHWLTQFGSICDTVKAKYQYDCRQQPPTLDVADFNKGPFQGKTLYGIIEWNSDTSLRIRYEIGSNPADRPAAFDADLTQRFERVK